MSDYDSESEDSQNDFVINFHRTDTEHDSEIYDSSSLSSFSRHSSDHSEMNSSDSSNSSDTESYDADQLMENIQANADESVIVINDTQVFGDDEAAPAPDVNRAEEGDDGDDGDDDVILVPQNIEIIDLCTQQPETPAALAAPRRRRQQQQQNEVIEILDGPSPLRVADRGVGPIRPAAVRRELRNRATPYQPPPPPLNATPTVPRAASSPPNLDDSQVFSQSQRIKVSCPICLDSVIGRNPQSTSCGHIFCKQCLLGALQTAKKCPMCRKGIGKNGFHNIHLS